MAPVELDVRSSAPWSRVADGLREDFLRATTLGIADESVTSGRTGTNSANRSSLSCFVPELKWCDLRIGYINMFPLDQPMPGGGASGLMPRSLPGLPSLRISRRMTSSGACACSARALGPSGLPADCQCDSSDTKNLSDVVEGVLARLKEELSDPQFWHGVPYSGGGGGLIPHDYLSATHPDTTPAAPVRGDVVVAQGASPLWTRLPLGAAGTFLRSNATDALWSAILLGDLPAHASTHKNGGSDEVATATPGAGQIPKALAGGKLDKDWVPDFVASGASHAKGAVPDPGAVAGTTKFLREDATFAVPPGTGVPTSRAINTTAPLTGGGDLSVDRTLAISDFVASGASHAKGAVPDPGAVAGTTKFLREDASWAAPSGEAAANKALRYYGCA